MTGQGQTNIDTALMRSGAGAISGTGEGIDGVRTGARQFTQNLLVTWRADAATIFGSAMEDFDQTCRNIKDRLDGLAANVNASADEFDHRNDTNTLLAKNVGNDIEPTTPGLVGFS